LQEGHRLAFVEPNGALQYQGIVYNEMKGAMNSLESRLWEALSKELLPNLPYAHNSGGNPKAIPNLTYEELLEFHRTYYHPSRCLFFFYGNLPLSKHLDTIEKTLAGQKCLSPIPPLPHQTRFKTPIYATSRYPIAKSESLEKKTEIAFAWLTVPIAHQSELLALCLLESILTDTDASPLTLALLKSDLCTQVDSSVDEEMSEAPWLIVCKGCDAKDADAIQKILFDTLKKFTPTQEQIDASLHQLEFQRKEIAAEGIPFGLTLFMRSALIKQHGSEPENGLLIHTLFSNLRERLKDKDYLPSLLRKYLIDNPHFVRLVMEPDPKLEAEEKQDEEKRLAAIRSRLTEKEAELIVKQTAELAAYQEAVEHQSIDCLPKVTLHDVPKHSRDFPLKHTDGIYRHDVFTNQILYADLNFDLPDLAPEDLSLVSLLSRLISEVGCGGKSYAEILDYQQAYTGGFDASLALHVTQDPNVCRPSFSLRGKALYQHADKLFTLFSDYATSPDLADKSRIKEWIQQHATELQSRLSKSALNYATQLSLSSFSTASYVHNQWYGIPYYQSVLKWAKKFPYQDLERVANLILGTKNAQLVVACDKTFTLPKLNLPSKDFTPWQGKYTLTPPESQARIIASPVAFTARGTRTIHYSPHLLIATELFSNVILHKEIREKGGAYGSGATYSPTSGNFHFYSYRDPNLNRTLATFTKAIETIANGSFNERELEEAKLGVIQTLDSPVPPGSRAMVAYSWLRAGRTLEMRQQFREQVLSATSRDIADAIQEHLLTKKPVIVSFLGQELWEKEKPPLQLIEI
jgi:Zn-dependent M16 (insulinase) family peptidase